MDFIQKNLEQLRSTTPLVHSITNYVVMNNTANALLAIGASPVMAHAHPEMEDMVKIAGSLVINIGTLDEYWVESMKKAIAAAEKYEKPWILDPVGAGATPYRNKSLAALLALGRPKVIRGNASEILALTQVHQQTKGVDSTHSSDAALEAGKALSKSTGAVLCISGAADYIIQQDRVVKVSNGHPWMGKVTGMGCTATALIGAFVAANKDPFEACVSAMACMGLAGEAAADLAKGPGTLQLHFYDQLFQLNADSFSQKVKLSDG